jgi:hypothetical protein
VPDDDQKPEPEKTKPERPLPEEGGSSAAEGQEDRYRPEAIAARVEQIGDETELERIARQEEQKLLERKKQKKGKRGLEAAASKRLAKIGEGTVRRPSAATDAYIPEADPLLERARHARRWIEQHRQVFGGVLAAAVVVVGGGFGWTYWQDKHAAEGSALLAQGFADEHGSVSDKEDDDEDSSKARQLYPTFKSVSDRRGAALARYRQVASKYPGTGAAILARLAEAGLLLDQSDAKAAIQAYQDVKASALALADAEVRGRALEGLGFARELLAQSDPADKDKHLDDALAAFKELEQVSVKGFKELGMYHQARVLQAKGDNAKATEVLKDVYKRVTDPGESRQFSYLEFVVEDRLREIDPAALPPKAAKLGPGAGGGARGGPDMTDPQIQELFRKLQQKAQRGEGEAPAAPDGKQ